MLEDVVNWIKAYIAKSPDPIPVPTSPPSYLQPGKRYRVVREFIDHDRGVHPVGEEWTFIGQNFVPYHDGMSWFVSNDGANQQHVRLQWLPEEQGDILDNLEKYLLVIPAT